MKYPIGIQTFEKIIEGGYVYVDKTDLVYKLVSSGEYYFLCRPRRFGKSLLTTTLEAYFQGKKDLFKGLAIENLEKEWVKYPVFHIDFTGGDYTKPSMIGERMNTYLVKWEEMFGKNDAEISLSDRFYGVLCRAKEQTGRHVVVLIDEYDKPLTDTIGLPEIQDQNRTTLQSLYGIFKRGDNIIKFTFLTGVTRYGKLGIFSAANNLRDISTTDDFASICGIKEDELHSYFDHAVHEFAVEKKLSDEEMYAILKRKYDGYHFTEDSVDIYNPFSLLNALNSKKISNYWFATGTPTYLVSMLKRKSYDLSKFSKGIDATAETMASFGNGDDNMIAALYQSGYLTIKKYDGRRYYTLGFPNEEVEDGFVQCLMTEYSGINRGDMDDDLRVLRDAIEADDVEGFMTQIQLIMSQVPFENSDPKLLEANFRNMIYLMIRFSGFDVKVEHPVLGGRIDIFFETNTRNYIIECKRDKSADEALSQIDEKKYAKKISKLDKQIVKIGVNFSSEERNISEWKIKV